MKKINFLMGLVVLLSISLVPTFASSVSEEKSITLTSDNTLVLNGEVSGENVAKLIQEVRELDQQDNSYLGKLGLKDKNDKPIYLFLYTPGGSIQSGLELLEALKGVKRPINTVTMFAASMGFQIVQNLGNRYIVGNGILMSHHGYGSSEGEFGGKSPSQVQNRMGLWERRLKEMDEQTVKRTNGKQTLETYQSSYDHELWATGKESVNMGYADNTVSVSCDSSLVGTNQKSLNFMGIEILYELDKCPLNTTPMNIQIRMLTNKGVKTLSNFLEEGGSFGSSCLQVSGVDTTKVCALDTSLTIERVNSVVNLFRDKYVNIQNHVIPMIY